MLEMNRLILKIIFAFLFCLIILIIFKYGLTQYFTLEYARDNLEIFKKYYAENPAKALAIYSVIYILVASLSIPGSGILTLTAGAIFGFWPGLAMVSFASSIGSTLALLLSRFFFRDIVQKTFKKQAALVNKGIEKEGAFYLLTLRLIPLFPFYIINIVMGLTSMKTMTFLLVSWVGMIARNGPLC